MKLKNIFHFIPYFFISLIFFYLTACSTKVAPKTSVSEVSEKTKITILQKVDHYLKENSRSLYAAKGYAKVKLKVKSKRENFDAAVIIDLNPQEGTNSPLRFRFEVLDDLGNTKSIIVSNGKNLSWQDFLKEGENSTELSDKNLRRFLPLASSIQETLGLLIGRMPTLNLQAASVAMVSIKENSGLYKINFQQGEMIWNEKEQAIEFLALKGKNDKLAFQYEGKKFIRAEILPVKEKKLILPSQIKMLDLKTKNEIEINYKIITIGTQIPFSSTLFELEH